MDRLDQLFQQFLRERTYINNVTPSTTDWYESAWKAFRVSQSDAPPSASASLIAKSDLQHFVVHLRERGLKPVSSDTWLRAMNAVCRCVVKFAPQRLEKRLIRTHDEARSRPTTCALAAM